MINNTTLSPQCLVLRFMREKRQRKLPSVAKEIGFKAKAIDFIETGRKIVSDEEILLFLKCYDYSLETFNEMIKINPLNKRTANFYFLTQN